MAQRTIPALLAAAVLALPMAAQAQQQTQPKQTWLTTSTSWALHIPGGAPIPCAKTGPWPESLYVNPGVNWSKPTTFRCGGVVIKREPGTPLRLRRPMGTGLSAPGDVNRAGSSGIGAVVRSAADLPPGWYLDKNGMPYTTTAPYRREPRLGEYATWNAKEKAGKAWVARVLYSEEHMPGPHPQYTTLLSIGGQQIQLIETVKGRFVPEPQPVLR